MHIPNYQDLAQRFQGTPLPTNTNIHLLIIDPQLCFTDPTGPLFVQGKHGNGAQDDMYKLRDWMFLHLDSISDITVSLDDHHVLQIFHPLFWIDSQGKHPDPYTIITEQDVLSQRWQVNPRVLHTAHSDGESTRSLVLSYLRHLDTQGTYQLMVWPYHALSGTVSSAIDPILEEALFAHSIRHQKPYTILRKGSETFSEQYAAFRTESTESTHVAHLKTIFQADKVFITGQARSHCLAWTIQSILDSAETHGLDIHKLHVLTDTTSDVVTPSHDYTENSDRIYATFADQGMHMITTKTPLV